MTGGWKDAIDTVTLTLKVDGQPHFLGMMTRPGLVKRMGVPRPEAHEGYMAVDEREGVFESVLDAFPERLPEHQGRHEADGDLGPRCDWKVELTGPHERVVLDLRYHAGSAGLPKAIGRVLGVFEDQTDAWYREAAPQAPITPQPVDDVPPQPDPEAWPSASWRRRLLGILVDLGLLSVPYAWLYFLMASPDGGAVPLLEGLVLFGIVELVLLQLVRWSPGYWALGISIPAVGPPLVDPELEARASWVTIVVGLALTGSGIDGMRDWAFGVPVPTPYFGLPWTVVPSVAITVVLGFIGVVSGLLVLRTEVRGIGWGVAFVALSLLAVVVGDTELWELWSVYMAQASAQARGRAPTQESVEGVASFLRTMMIVLPLVYAVGLGLAWRRLRPGAVTSTP